MHSPIAKAHAVLYTKRIDGNCSLKHKRYKHLKVAILSQLTFYAQNLLIYEHM